MRADPPRGSKITVQRVDGQVHIVIPQAPTDKTMRVLTTAALIFGFGFMLYWLSLAIRTPFSTPGGKVILGMLIPWIVMVHFTIRWLHRLYQAPIAEKLVLNKPNLRIDNGLPADASDLRVLKSIDPNPWRAYFPKRAIFELKPDQISTLALRATEFGYRLTVDCDDQQHAIARSASESEKRWLYDFLKESYELSNDPAHP